MRICVDIQPAVSQRAGIGRYTKSLVQHLGEFSGDDHVLLFHFDFKGRGLGFEIPGAELRSIRWCPGRAAQQAWKRLHFPPYNWFAGAADVYHFPNFVIPPLSVGRKVVTIHDMSFVRHPDFAEDRNLRFLSAAIRYTADRADAIVTDSGFSASEIVDILGVASDRVFPIHLGVAPECVRPDNATLARTRQALGLDRPYLLTVGTIEPRKNIPFLVEIFERLSGFDGDLVLAGMDGWKFQPILDRIRSSPKAARIRRLRGVPDEQMPALYAGAEALVITSFYEGFGLPPLEAMACGTPVISSCGGSLPEVLTPAAVLIQGFDPAPWCAAIQDVLRDTARRNRMIQAGLDHAARYTWRETARKTWDVYRRVVS